MPETDSTKAVWVDLPDAARQSDAPSGPQWSHESADLDLTLLSWADGRGIEPHKNDEIDVVWVGIEGEGRATVDGEVHELRPGVTLLIPKGAVRSVWSVSTPFLYLSIHRRRAGLRPTLGRGGRTPL